MECEFTSSEFRPLVFFLFFVVSSFLLFFLSFFFFSFFFWWSVQGRWNVEDTSIKNIADPCKLEGSMKLCYTQYREGWNFIFVSRLFFFLLYFLSFFSLSRKSIPILFQFYPELSYETLYTAILIRINLSTENFQFVSILFVVDDKNFRWKKLDQKRVVLILLNYSCAVLPSVSVPFHDGHRLFFFLLIRLPFFN